MASTYVNNLRLEEIGSGEQSGTWGDTTNTNLELIGQATAWGTRAIANASTDNITIADGAADADRCLGLKLTGGGQACTVTLLPNTSSKTWFMYNATSFDLTFTCGSGANVIIPAGHTKVIATDGLGSGGVVHDLLTDLNVASNLFVKNPGTGDNSTANIYLQTAEADIAANDVIGKINFQAPNEGTGTDAILVSAAIQAISEGDFSSSSNATSLNFMTGASEAATTKMTLSSGGNLTVTGVVTANAGVVVDNITIDGFEIDSTTDFTIDASGDINLDADGGDIRFKDGGTEFYKVSKNGDHVQLFSIIQDGDLTFNGFDGSSHIVALTLDMSNAGAATFNAGVFAGAASSFPSITINNNSYIGSANNTTAIQIATSGDVTFADGVDIITSTAGTSNVRFGVNAGNSIVSGGNYNTVVGDEAGTAITTGDDNVAIGYNALITEDAHGNNVAIGSGSLKTLNAGAHGYNVGVGVDTGNDLTTGLYNTLIGALAGDALTDADENVAVGTSALGADVLGSKSTAIGASALNVQNNVDGSGNPVAADMFNTAVGYYAGVAVTTGKLNTLIGGLAGDALTTGGSNVAVGHLALSLEDAHGYNVAIGDSALSVQNAGADAYNVAIGYYSGFATSTGIQNTFVGSATGAFHTTGNNNTFLGYESGKSITGARLTGASNTAVGCQAGLLLQGAANNNTLIGAQAADLLTTGTYNVGVGAASLGASAAASTTGDHNTALGSDSLGKITTGDDNIGIGSSALLNITTGSNNTAVGRSAGTFATTAAGSTFVGHNAGLGITGAKLTGANNTAVGKDAGELLQGAANNNTLIGAQAGDQITTGTANTSVGFACGGATAASTGTFNTSVGFVAGGALTTGNQNVFMGSYVSDAMTIGRYNTAAGYSALSADVLGDRTTAIGYQSANYQVAGSNNATMANSYLGMYAGHYNVVGTGNTAMGYQALFGADGESGTNNVAIGRNAGGICRGDENTLVGKSSGEDVSTGDYNACLGNGSGKNINTGSRNVCIGNIAGQNITEGENNITIGNSAETSAVGGDNQIVMGESVTGVGNTNFTFGNGATDSNIEFGATSITAPSDIRLKEDIQDETIGLGFINDLRPVTFQWKKEKDIPEEMKTHVASSEKRVMNGKHNHGFIAQEVKAVIDNHDIKDGFDMWTEDEADGRQRIGDASLMPIMVKAVQELSTALDVALARIEKLES